MTVRIDFKGGYSTEDLLALNELSSLMNPARQRNVLTLRATLGLLGALSLAAAWAVCTTAGKELYHYLLMAITLPGGVVCIAAAVRFYPLAARLTRRVMRGSMDIAEILDEDGVTECLGGESTRISYGDIRFIAYYKKTYFLFLKGNRAVLLPLRLTERAPEALELFLERHTGMEIRRYGPKGGKASNDTDR